MDKTFNFKTIKMKVLLCFMLVLGVFLAYSVYTVINTNIIHKKTDSLVSKDLKIQTANEEIALDFTTQIAAVRGYILSNDEDYLAIFHDSYASFIKDSEQINKIQKSKENATLFSKATTWNEQMETNVIKLYQNGDREQALKNLTSLDKTGTDIRISYEKNAEKFSNQIISKGNQLLDKFQSVYVIGLIVTFAAIIVFIAIALFTANAIAHPIQKVTKRLTALADGDLSQKNETITSRDEIGQLSRQTNLVNDHLQSIITQVKDIADKIAGNSTYLANSANDINKATQHISTTMQEISEGSEQQASSTTNLSTTTESYVENIQRANEKGEQFYQVSKDVLQATSTGSDLMQESTLQMQSIDKIINNAVSNIQVLNSESEEISSLIEVINDIAQQTNLLALNAAIESARAGEAGKGFAVVADEVRKLAEQVSGSVTDISVIVENIQVNTKTMSDSLEIGYDEVVKGTQKIQETSSTFTEIYDSVSNMSLGIQEISNDLHSIKEGSFIVQKSVDDLASVSEESAAGVQETTATIEETTSSMEEISNHADDLSRMSQQLIEMTNKFNLN
ncbi:MAG: methyl-accepting chemotaxis protein [Kurthia sp.]|nr:methyl-accepting chemotaxis protein [Candidatus Kurthia equi]